uniref:dolichyl-diphosphooligosaccharide--protein glycotransferase n=1 Tax=Trichuris muris TaxID=70415 RepID=A0A5S6QAS6_TRIMR
MLLCLTVFHTVTAGADEMKYQRCKNSVTSAGWKHLVTVTVLILIWLVGFSSRLFSVVRFESIIHEFDPWFNYRATRYMVENGYYKFLNWFDERAWYPLGRIVGGTVYPGLMLTSGFIHHVLHSFNIPIHIREICVFLAPFFSGLTAVATFLLTQELWSHGAGLFAAAFMAIAPGYISRSVAGSYDNEGIAIFALQMTYFLWIRSVKTGSIFWATLTALFYSYMVSAWGGYVFIINLIPLHVLMLVVMGRFNWRIYVAYNVFFTLGLILSMQTPFVGFQPVRTSEHMAAIGVFGLINGYAAVCYLQSVLVKQTFRRVLYCLFVATIVVGFFAIVHLTYAGIIAPWSGRFYSLWDTEYARIHIPIISSVSEHQPTTWFAFFIDLHILVVSFPAGLYLCIKEVNDERVFVILYAMTSVYFAGVMIRLMLTLTPVVCIMSGIAFSCIFERYLRDETADPTFIMHSFNRPKVSTGEQSVKGKDKTMYDKAGKLKKPSKIGNAEARDQLVTEDEFSSNLKTLVSVAFLTLLAMFVIHCTWVTSNAYSSPSVVLATYLNDGTRNILDDFREAYYWLSQNTADQARVMSWWDYGYQIAGMANRTTLVDNNTWNNSHIALVGKAMSSNESEAYKIMRALDVDYVLVIFGGLIGYSGDDINKFLWMVRIAEGEHPKEIHESDYFTEDGDFRVDHAGSPTLLNCLMYKLSFFRFGEVQTSLHTPNGFDRTRGVEIGNKNFNLNHLEEAFTSENWLVRIYKVKELENRYIIPYADRVIKLKKPTGYGRTSNSGHGRLARTYPIKRGTRRKTTSRWKMP